ncbi:histidine phosphatase family protein [Nonomuraea basaltis]|uniref:histidine phosphatase family protein n=1 Tax=Nonomuraea basaltis TaxID=2495887 RepID=UPI001F111784|nr:histidine phosphatase family protein [Nonomuraea basaltis]
MLFVRHATTPGMRAACFPADEDADAASLARAAAALGPMMAGATAWAAPTAAARQTAAAVGLEARVTPALAEADCGRWRGLPYARVAREEPDALASWLTDPHAAPHGGESPAELAARVAGWLDTVRALTPASAGASAGASVRTPGRAEPDAARAELHVVVFCDAGAIRAALGHALGLDPPRTARFDLAPLSLTELTATRAGWRVGHVNRKVLS